MANSFAYDVFLSHSSKDKPIVRELAQRLKADGLRVWFDEWEIKPGDMIGLKIEQGLEHSRTLVLCMSRNAFASEWVTLERHTALFRDPTNAERRFIPVRLDDAKIKDTLKQFAYIDWQTKELGEYMRLLATCRPMQAVAEEKVNTEQYVRCTAVLKGHTGAILGIAISADGRRAVSGSFDNTVRVWDLEKRRIIATLHEHSNAVYGLALTPDGTLAVSGSADGTARVWNLETGKLITNIRHWAAVNSVAVTPDGRRAVLGSANKTVLVLDLESGKRIVNLERHAGSVWGVAITADGRRVISGSEDGTVQIWDLKEGKTTSHIVRTGPVLAVAITADGRHALWGALDNTLRLWDLRAGRPIATFEGHTNRVLGIAMTPNGQRAVSSSEDSTVRVWDLALGKLIATLEGHTFAVNGVAISADGRRAVSGSDDNTVRVWDLPPMTVAPAVTADTTRYTNAKVLLVGESGVGKTGLAYRLTENVFRNSVSTDAAWATQLKLPDTAAQEGIEREIWLWDFAGQADYRLIHQLYMDETALAVLVFNPQSENPFEGLGQWDRDLQRAARRRFKKLLVAGRVDRGGLMVSRDSIEQFRKERGFDQYIETSALRGTGTEELRDAIIDTIPWTDIPWTSSPRIFRLLKEEIVKLKDEGKVLLRATELRQQLEMRVPGENFTLEQLRAVVGLLAGPGVVWQLEFGDFVLLQPERINAYAAAVIRSVRAHTEEIGSIAEEDVLAGRLDYQDMKRLPPDEEQIVLRAMHRTFVDHGLCLREHTGRGTLLIFPSYFKRERPELEGHPAPIVTYHFSGALDEIYATLVVRLNYTESFEKDRLWRFAADFKTPSNQRIGLMMTKKTEGAAELTVYSDPQVHPDTQVTFIRYVHEHLKSKTTDVERERHYVCKYCSSEIENRRAVQERLKRGQQDIVCATCEKRVQLWDLIEEKFASEEFQRRVRELEEQAKARIDNESRELILVGHAYAIAGEAGQIYRQYTNSDHGIDGEIEFKDYAGKASGKRLYLQLKSGDSYLTKRGHDEAEIFTIKNARHAEYWQQQAYPVMLVIRASDGTIRWMDVSEYLKRESAGGKKTIKQIMFDGEPLTALNVLRMRDRFIPALV